MPAAGLADRDWPALGRRRHRRVPSPSACTSVRLPSAGHATTERHERVVRLAGVEPIRQEQTAGYVDDWAKWNYAGYEGKARLRRVLRRRPAR